MTIDKEQFVHTFTSAGSCEGNLDYVTQGGVARIRGSTAGLAKWQDWWGMADLPGVGSQGAKNHPVRVGGVGRA